MRSVVVLRIVALMLLVTGAWAKPTVVAFSELQPSEQQRRTSLIIAQVLENFHYTRPDINNQLSSLALARYLETLDVNRSFLTRHDVVGFKRYEHQFDNNLLSGDLEPAFVIFRHFRQRVTQRVSFAKHLLDTHTFDYTSDETYQFDRTEGEWAADEGELNNLWRLRVKNDLLTERLAKENNEDFDEAQVKEALHKRYDNILRRVQQMTANDVFQAFVNAFTLSIEPHTSYMSPRTSENFDIGMRLSLQGIGAVLSAKNEYTVIQRTIPGGPAAKSGELRGGDRIVGVAQDNGGSMEDVVGWRLEDVVDLIRGPKGSTVRLSILPKSEVLGGRTREVVLVRDKIKLEDKAAKSEILSGPELGGLKIGVIDIPAFYLDFAARSAGERNYRSTTRDVRRLLDDMRRDAVDGVIIDLRQNGGGALDEAIALTGLFIEQGPVVQVKDTSGDVDVYRDEDDDLLYNGPLMVLVDRNSASASEIFAGAIQDYGRGLVVGEPTFGKGTVQTLVDLRRIVRSDENFGRLRLTSAQFFRVLGGSTQHRGVTPDIVFPTAKGATEHGERGLDHAIPWASIKPAINQQGTDFELAYLLERDKARIAKDPGFRFLLETENELIEIADRKQVSLNEQTRRMERAEREKRQLASRNRLREYRGLEPLKDLDADEDKILSEEEEDPEKIGKIMLDEAANILSDYIKLRRPLTAQIH